MITMRIRWLSLLAIFAVAAASADYWPQGDPRSGGMRDVMLLYIGEKDHYTTADLMPYVAYLDKSRGGRPLDWFYDSYLFMMFSGAPSGTSYIEGPTSQSDWKFYIDGLFEPNKNIAALDAAVSEAAQTLGPPRQKVPVMLMIPYPNRSMKTFGDVDGSGRVLDFSNAEDTARAVAWLVDETSRRFNAAGYKNLRLWGYYWMMEGISPPDEANVKAAARVLHERGFGFHWIPWFNAPGIDRWRDLGFDFVVMQPNYAFMPAPRDEQRLAEAAALCRKYDMGIEMEVSFGTLQSATDRDNLSDYLNYGLPLAEGYMSAVHGYYQGTLDVGRMYASDLPANNRLYRDLYLFHKQQYVWRDRSVGGGLVCEVRAPGRPPVKTTALTTPGKKSDVRLPGGTTIVWLDLPMPLRVEEVRLHLSQSGRDVDALYLARAYACDNRADKGRLIGEAVGAQFSDQGAARGATLPVKGPAQLARCVRVDISGPPGAEAVLDWLRVFAAGGAGPAGPCTADGEGNAAGLTDGLYASSRKDAGSTVRWLSGKGSLTVSVPADRFLGRLWLHAVKVDGGQWPAKVTATLGGKTVEATPPALPPSDWSGYIVLHLPRVLAPSIAVSLEGAAGKPVALDEIEVEPATNLASGKPYTVDPPKPAKYPDDGKKLTDGQLSEGFGDGKTVGWISTNPSLIVDLGEPRAVDKVRVHVEGGGLGGVYLPRSMLASTSADGQTWTPALRRLVPKPEPPGGTAVVMQWLEMLIAAPDVRYVKLDFLPNVWLMLDEIEVESGGKNVALGCTYRLLVAPASEANYRDDGRKLTDGQVSEGQWNADRVVGYADADPTITLDLLAPQAVGLVAAHVCGGGPAGVFYPREMSVQTSADGVTWSDAVVTSEHPAETGKDATVALMQVPVSATARFVRLYFKHYGWCMVDEVEVYGPAG